MKRLMVSVVLLSLAFPVLARDGDLKPRSIKAKAYSAGNAAFLTTEGKPFLHKRSKFSGTNHRIELSKELKHFDTTNNFGVKKETMLGYGAHIKHEKTFKGAYKSAISEELAELLIAANAIPRYTYTEHPLVECYDREVPMMWQLQSAKEFVDIRTCFEARLKERKIVPRPYAILLLTIKEDPNLVNLSKNDYAFLKRWFTQVTLEDAESCTFFGEMQEKMIDENYKLDGSKPDYKLETIPETLFRMFQKTFSGFELDDLVTVVAGSFGGILLKEALTGPITSSYKGLITFTKNLVPPLNLNTANELAHGRIPVRSITRSGGKKMDVYQAGSRLMGILRGQAARNDH